MRMIRQRIAVSLISMPVMTSYPKTTTTVHIVEAIRVENLLNLFQTQLPRILRRHFIARGFGHQAQFVTDLRVELTSGFRSQFKIRQENADLRNAGRILDSIGVNHRQAQTAK